MNINRKITLKGVTTNVNLLINSRYTICEYDTPEVPDLQIAKDKFDVISINNNLFVHKHIIGGYFTYRVSSSKTCQFTYSSDFGKYRKRAGRDGIIKVLIIDNYFN